MKVHLFSKMSQGLLLLSTLLVTSYKESSNNFFVPDHEAPSLVSVTPVNDETAEENNTTLLTFNEYVKAREGKTNLNGEEVEPTFRGKTASYAYTALDYNQVCQPSLPRSAVIDFQRNVFEGVNIQSTIRERSQPEVCIFDAVVSPDGKGSYTSIQEAIDNVPSKRTEPRFIFVANGTYEEQIIIPENKPYIHLIGRDVDKTAVKSRINSPTEAGATDPDVRKCSYKNLGETEVAMVSVKAVDLYVENISFVNGYGRELQEGPMALAMYTQNDRNSFNNCKLLSHQDIWQTGPKSDNGRLYAQNCWIEGAVDYFYRNGNCLLEHYTFYNVRDGAAIVAPSHKVETRWGHVLNNRIVDGDELADTRSVRLGRPWHNSPIAVYLNMIFNIKTASEGWADMGAIPQMSVEYSSKDKEGNAVDLSQHKTQCTYQDEQENPVTGICQAVLTAGEAARYTYENVVREGDNRDSKKYIEQISAPENLKRENGILSWDAPKCAICYLVITNDETVQITKETSCNVEEGETCQVRVVSEYGSLSELSEE